MRAVFGRSLVDFLEKNKIERRLKMESKKRKKFKEVFWSFFGISSTLAIMCFLLYGGLKGWGPYQKVFLVLLCVFAGISFVLLFVIAVGTSITVKEPPKVFSIHLLRSILWGMRIRGYENLCGGELLRGLPDLITETEANAIVACSCAFGFEVSEQDFNELLYMRTRGWDIVGKYDAKARGFREPKKIGMDEFDAIVERSGKHVGEFNECELALIVNVAKTLNIPVTIHDELKAELSKTEADIKNKESSLDEKQRDTVIIMNELDTLVIIKILQEALMKKVNGVMLPKKSKKPSTKKSKKKS
jgi:hypothetical protein